MSGAANNPYKQEAPDKTLTQEGVAADAKAVGDALKGAKLNVKHRLYSVTTDQYSQASLSTPSDCTAVLYFTCDKALVWPRNFKNGTFIFQCFGNIRDQVLNTLPNTNLSIELYYL
jgi:hypothetical protein